MINIKQLLQAVPLSKRTIERLIAAKKFPRPLKVNRTKAILLRRRCLARAYKKRKKRDDREFSEPAKRPRIRTIKLIG